MARYYPKAGQVYTLAQIENELNLDDSPSLSFRRIDGKRGLMQTSHLTKEELLSIPGMADSEWQYLRTTSEWIPLFTYVGVADPKTLVDVEPWEDDFGDQPDLLWITPKGFPRKQ
jgi:hypothetical protein